MSILPAVCARRAAAFTLIEMIGVLAIIAILAAAIVPKVIETIRDSKISSAVASVNAARVAANQFHQRYESIPLDAEITIVYDYKVDPTGDPPPAYTPPVPPLDFGDVLVYQSQLLEKEATTVGRPTDLLTHAIGSSKVGSSLIGGASYAGSHEEMHFKSAGAAGQIVYYFMPNLSTQEAAAIARQINGPFGSDALSERDFIDASLVGQGVGSVGGLEGANAWFSPGDKAGEYHAYIYVSHR